MFEKFTTRARQVVVDAQQEAHRLGHDRVGTEHLLLALVGPDGDGAARLLSGAGLTPEGVRAAIVAALGEPRMLTDEDAAALEAIGIDVEAVRARIEESFGPGALAPEPAARPGLFGGRRTPFTPRSKKVLELALREAIRLRHRGIGTEHVLLGLIREGKGLAAKIMAEAGIDLPALRRTTEESLRAAA